MLRVNSYLSRLFALGRVHFCIQKDKDEVLMACSCSHWSALEVAETGRRETERRAGSGMREMREDVVRLR